MYGSLKISRYMQTDWFYLYYNADYKIEYKQYLSLLVNLKK